MIEIIAYVVVAILCFVIAIFFLKRIDKYIKSSTILVLLFACAVWPFAIPLILVVGSCAMFIVGFCELLAKWINK